MGTVFILRKSVKVSVGEENSKRSQVTGKVFMFVHERIKFRCCENDFGDIYNEKRMIMIKNRDFISQIPLAGTSGTFFPGGRVVGQRLWRGLGGFIDARHGRRSRSYPGHPGHRFVGGELWVGGGGGALTILLMRGMNTDLRFFW